MRKAYLLDSREEYESLVNEFIENGIKWLGGFEIQEYNPYIHFPEFKSDDQIVVYDEENGLTVSRYYYFYDINRNDDNKWELIDYTKLKAERK